MEKNAFVVIQWPWGYREIIELKSVKHAKKWLIVAKESFQYKDQNCKFDIYYKVEEEE